MKSVERWKPIKGQEGRYEVSSLGRVKSLIKNKEITESLNHKGYPRVRLCCPIQKVNKTYQSHRLVAMQFVPNPLNKPQVNHINGIKTDNHYKNLEWVTNSENQRHAKKLGLLNPEKGSDRYNSSLEKGDASKMRELHKNGISTKEISKMFNCCRNVVWRIIKNKSYLNE